MICLSFCLATEKKNKSTQSTDIRANLLHWRQRKKNSYRGGEFDRYGRGFRFDDIKLVSRKHNSSLY